MCSTQTLVKIYNMSLNTFTSITQFSLPLNLFIIRLLFKLSPNESYKTQTFSILPSIIASFKLYFLPHVSQVFFYVVPITLLHSGADQNKVGNEYLSVKKVQVKKLQFFLWSHQELSFRHLLNPHLLFSENKFYVYCYFNSKL